MTLTLHTLAERPALAAQFPSVERQVWPRFILDGHEEVGERLWPRLCGEFPGFQIAVCDDAGAVVAVGNSIPFAWDGTDAGLPSGWNTVLAAGFQAREEGTAPTALSALAASVSPAAQRQGISSRLLVAMKTLAAERGLERMVAPVRPPLKTRYPLTPMERYIRWTTADGEPFDPWIRTHVRLGARIVGVAHRSMVTRGTVSEWETWTDMSFPESGDYIIPGAMAPLAIHRERDLGLYEEPNCWVVHPRHSASPASSHSS
jgi:GNAT superfamily N-acetyltransferase